MFPISCRDFLLPLFALEHFIIIGRVQTCQGMLREFPSHEFDFARAHLGAVYIEVFVAVPFTFRPCGDKVFKSLRNADVLHTGKFLDRRRWWQARKEFAHCALFLFPYPLLGVSMSVGG